ncbi:MAG: glycosyltransferase family 2 protein [Synechococcaceae cyanobacterium]
MRLGMTLLVRDEADLLRTHLEHHLAQGVDFFLITDNGSLDATPAIAAAAVERGLARLIHEPADTYEQSRWVSRMARLAAEEHGADWVIHSDADEFWISRQPGQTLREAIVALPPGCRRLSVPRWNALISRELDAAQATIAPEPIDTFERDPRNSLGDPLPPKVLHRADPSAVVAQGNHGVTMADPGVPVGEERLLILHVPYRGRDPYRHKIRIGGRAYLAHPGAAGAGLTWRIDYRHYLAGRLDAICRWRLPSEQECEAQRAEGRAVAAPNPITLPATPRLGAPPAPSAPAAPLPPVGIVTLADDNYFCGTRLLTLSIEGQLPIVVYDLGLGEEACAWIEAHEGIERRSVPDTPLVRAIQERCGENRMAKATKREWPLWICPTLIEAAPFARAFWIDSDIVVLRELAPMVESLAEGPFLVEENLAPHACDNPPQLYDLLPIGQSLHEGNRLRLNAGLSGWDLCRDAHLLEAYQFPIRQVFLRGALPREAVRWHDQGALIWALQQAGYDDRLLRPRRFNLCVQHSALRGQRIAADADDDTLRAWIAEARELERDAATVHWNGHPVPWSP